MLKDNTTKYLKKAIRQHKAVFKRFRLRYFAEDTKKYTEAKEYLERLGLQLKLMEEELDNRRGVSRFKPLKPQIKP